MTPAQFFEKFDLLSNLPNAVGKIRELILDLAVSGRFCFAEEAGASMTYWTKESLGDIASIITKGATPTTYGFSYESTGIPFIKVENIIDGSISKQSIESFISQNAHDFLKRSQLAADDILFSIAGTIGKTCVVAKDDVPANTNQALAIIRGFAAHFDVGFLKLQLDSFISRKAKNRARGGAMLNISLSDLRDLQVVIPPLAEQKRIVAKVDELMALCDRLEAQQKQREAQQAALVQASLTRFTDAPTPTNLEFLFHKSYAVDPAELRKTILTLAVQGRLVAQNQNDEQVLEWLARMHLLTSSLEIVDIEPPVACPITWRWFRIETLCTVAGGIQKTPARAPRNNAYPYLGVANVYRGRLDLTDVKRFELESGELEKRRLVRGDLLIIEGNGSYNEIGRCAKWNGEIDNCVHQNHVIRCRPCDESISDWILLYLNSPNGTETMQRLAITSSGLYSLSVGKIRQILFPLPPLAEQKRIVAKVEELMGVVDRLEAQLAASREVGAKLIEAVVAEIAAAA